MNLNQLRGFDVFSFGGPLGSPVKAQEPVSDPAEPKPLRKDSEVFVDAKGLFFTKIFVNDGANAVPNDEQSKYLGRTQPAAGKAPVQAKLKPGWIPHNSDANHPRPSNHAEVWVMRGDGVVLNPGPHWVWGRLPTKNNQLVAYRPAVAGWAAGARVKVLVHEDISIPDSVLRGMIDRHFFVDSVQGLGHQDAFCRLDNGYAVSVKNLNLV